LRISFLKSRLAYRRLDADRYVASLRKSQGSQFKRVIVPIQTSRILDRTLIYTAITRATDQVVLVGDRAVFNRVVAAAPSASRRQTVLATRLV
jgi:exodeoxyribonuclease V alpha subunit